MMGAQVAVALCLLLVVLSLWPGALANAAATTSLAAFSLPGVDEQLVVAQTCLDKWRQANSSHTASERLAVVYLHSHTEPSVRDRLLGCSVTSMLQNIGHITPMDIFVFSMEAAYDHLTAQLNEQLHGDMKRVCHIKIPQKQWRYQPRKTQYKQSVNINRYGDYLTMGLWRMLVPYNIIAHPSLGYPYFLQVNMVQEMRKRNYTMATHRQPLEYWHVMYGLPELAKFYLMSHKAQPGTSLFRHVKPANMQGLFSPSSNWWRKPDEPREGYDLVVLYGNFLGMSTALWRDERVQDFIHLCINSGGLERHRWQEQGVFTFIYLLFTDQHQLWRIYRAQLQWLHTRRMEKLKPVCPALN